MAATSVASRLSAAKRSHPRLPKPAHFPVIWMLLLLLLPLFASAAMAAPTSTPTPTPTADRRHCPHKGLGELIRTSPVIVKALAARIFTDAELAQLAEQPVDMLSGSASASPTASEAATILITLTPETIYKGASLLKMANGAAAEAADGGPLAGEGAFNSGARRSGFSSISGSSGWSGTGAAYQYEGQLNATLQPLHCFDANMLKMLPTELIAFGKLLPASAVAGTGFPASSGAALASRQMQRPGLGASLGGAGDVATDKDVLHISVNGLHRWTPQFENHIWKHLGWDDWSDFTLCSVTCGKGVQQRFRRCLLDNPLVDIGMNMNLNLNLDDDDDEDDGEVEEDAAEELKEELNVNVDAEVVADEANNEASAADAAAEAAATAAAFNADNNEVLGHDNAVGGEAGDEGEPDDALLLMMQPAAGDFLHEPAKQQRTMSAVLHKFTQTTPTTTAAAGASTASTHVPAGVTSGGNEATGTGVRFVSAARNDRRRTRADNQHKKKKRKTTKSLSLSTLLCEGYNIEQRNCNSFECSDDISDLLKFYKKLPLPVVEELPTVASNDSVGYQPGLPPEFADLTTVIPAGVPASSTPSNMGYIRSWRNMLNFTLMITLRAKNDTKNASTIFSIRNMTHNLYLEACQEGLRLYLERDSTTEMLPVKFNLYDYRWHQVAISIQNGDFISIYVDCLWTNSFVVSKRLFTLPLDADVEIGRGFNGELQQLLVLPEHQERLQCSNKRTSINEVKRYIIDTFIEDYGSN